MGKKKKRLILSQKQLNEIIGGAYFTEGDDFNPDGEVSANATIVNGNNGYGKASDAHTLDRFSRNKTNNNRGFYNFFGNGAPYGPDTLRESNQDIDNKTYQLNPTTCQKLNGYGSNSIASNAMSNGIKGENLHTYIRRLKTAQKENPQLFQQMGGQPMLDELTRLNNNAKSLSKNIRNSKPEGSKIKSAPKSSGNGKAHTSKNNGNGYINYF